jgi:hypothetical protein
VLEVPDDLGVPDELGATGGLEPFRPGMDPFEDMFGQFFDDAGLVLLLEVLLDDDELEFVVTMCPVEVAGAERAKAAAVPPPTSAPDTPTAVNACLSFRRM